MIKHNAIFIVGPTATGKTDLAISLISELLKFPGVDGVDILSADSKQVYIDQDIVTGKDKSKFQNINTQVFGLDLVAPDVEWSLAHFMRYAADVFAEAIKKNHLVLVVGGTGLYLNALINPPETAVVPRDESLRLELDKLSVIELQMSLQTIDPIRFSQMNESDRMNPRRLVRAIEIAMYPGRDKHDVQPIVDDALLIGLELEKTSLEQKIQARVKSRIKLGAITETKSLLAKYPHWTNEAKAAIGYNEIVSYLNRECSELELIKIWSLHELQYASRQMTWFKKMENINWFEADDLVLKDKVAQLIRSWYTNKQ